MKELCEARAKLEMSSNLADKLLWPMSSPLHETAGKKSELFTYLYCQWEPIWNSQLIRKYQGILLLQVIEADWLADGPPIQNCQ